MKRSVIILIAIAFVLGGQSLYTGLSAQQVPIPKIDFNITEASSPKDVALSVQVLLLITLLSMAPAIILMLTSFTKIIIIFDFAKRALSLQRLRKRFLEVRIR